MAVILPIVKALLPHVAQIAAVAIPAFTKKPEEVKGNPVVAQQIEELQSAATTNNESIQLLAEKLQQTIRGIEQGAEKAEGEITKLRTLLFVSWAMSIGALIVAVLAYVN